MAPGMGLVRALDRHFDLEELKTLCFQVGGGSLYDTLAGEGKAAKARELVDWARRYGKEDALIGACYSVRPNMFFDEAIKRVPTETFQLLREVPFGNGTKRLNNLRLARIEGEQSRLAGVQAVQGRKISATLTMGGITLGLVFLLLVQAVIG